jgi:hypothetical protein
MSSDTAWLVILSEHWCSCSCSYSNSRLVPYSFGSCEITPDDTTLQLTQIRGFQGFHYTLWGVEGFGVHAFMYEALLGLVEVPASAGLCRKLHHWESLRLACAYVWR